MPSVLVTPPAAEPVTIAEARLHLKEIAVGTDIDAKIMQCVTAARQMCENDLRRALITQTWKVLLDAFPRPGINVSSANWYGPQWGNSPGPLQNLLPDGTTGYEIFLPYPPLISVDSITYIDQTGATQNMNVATDIIVNNVAEPGMITPAFNTSWPVSQVQMGAMFIQYKCGYGLDGTLVPGAIKQWILTQVGAMYDLPQAELAAYRETLLAPTYVDRLLDTYRIRRF